MYYNPRITPKLLVFTVCLSSQNVKADFAYELFTEYEASDNILEASELNPDQIIDGDRKAAGLSFALGRENNQNWNYSISGEYILNKYSEELIRDDKTKTAVVNLLYKPESNNFRLAVYDSFQQIKTDRTSTQTFNNQNDVNVFSVVPSYFIRTTSLSQIGFNYRYAKVTEEQDVTSREIQSGGVGYTYDLSRFLQLSINGAHSETEYVDTDDRFVQNDYYLRFAYNQSLTSAILDIGIQDLTEPDIDTQNLFSLSLARQLNSNSDIRLILRTGYSEITYVDVNNQLTQTAVNSQTGYLEGIIVEDTAILNYNVSGGSLIFGSSIEFSSLESAEESTLGGNEIDEDSFIASVNLDYLLSASTSRIGFEYMKEKRDFNISGIENEVSTITLKYEYNLTRSLTMALDLISREAIEGIPQTEISEKSALLRFTYSPAR